MKIRNLKGGIFYRPVDTPAGKAGWCGDIFYEKFTPRRNKNGKYDQRTTARTNWTWCEFHVGPNKNRTETESVYKAEFERLSAFVTKTQMS